MSQLDPSTMSRRQQLSTSFRMTRETDPASLWWTIGAFIVGAALGYGLVWIFPGSGWILTTISVVTAILAGVLLAMVVFGRRAQKAAFTRLEGQPGSSYAALTMLRRGWTVEQMPVAFTKQQDMVFRVVGPPGIVLVGEGQPTRVKQLLINERRKHERVMVDTPITEVIMGDGEGQVPLTKMSRHVMKLGRKVSPAEVTDIIHRLRALDTQRGNNLPLPKGPIPTSMKGMRSQMRGR
ncbi:MAG: DUF4191 domain-containing protein [Nocardioides sp.]